MNQTQRDYLINMVQKTYQSQIEKLEKKIKSPPSLNNYIVAAFLDNSIELNDVKALKKIIRQRVIKFGSSDVLIAKGSNSRRRRGYYDDDDDEDGPESPITGLLAQDLFVIPENYKRARQEWQEEKDEIYKEIEILTAHRDTILLKVQLGSNEVLQKLVEQADNMADLNLVSAKLLILEKPNKIEDKRAKG